MYFVPAFTGLLAPHWRADARGVIIGLTWSTNRAHIARALLEAICFQTQELLSVVRAESGLDLDKLLVDGGMANDPFILQMLADITGLTIGTASRRSHVSLGSLCSLLIEAPKLLVFLLELLKCDWDVSVSARQLDNLFLVIG